MNAQEIKARVEKAIDWAKEQTGPPQGGPPREAPAIPAEVPEPISQNTEPERCPHGYRRLEPDGHCERWPAATVPSTPTREPDPIPTAELTPTPNPTPTREAPTTVPASTLQWKVPVSTPTPGPAPTQTFGQWVVKEQAELECDPGYHFDHSALSVTPPYDAKFVCCPNGTRYDKTTDSCEWPAIPTPLPTATPYPTRSATPTQPPAKGTYLPGYEGPELAIAAMTLLIRGNSGSGSGFFYPIGEGDDAQWAVVTNHHVVEGQKELEVCWAVTQTCRKAEVLHWGSKEFDVAILDYERFNPNEETRNWMWDVALKDWNGWGEEWEKGDVVYASGYPDKTTDWYGSYKVPLPVVTEGTVYHGSTVFQHTGEDGDYHTGHYIEHSAEVSPGNSGGPLMNSEGWIIGVNATGSHEPKRIEGAIPMSWVNHWADTGEEPNDWLHTGYDVLTFADGSFYAVLTWEEHGDPGWRYSDGEGNPCVSLVYELSENRYSWGTPICYASGYEAEDGTVFVGYEGNWYLAPEIPLNGKPEWR